MMASIKTSEAPKTRGAGFVYQPTYTDRHGEKKTAATWTICYSVRGKRYTESSHSVNRWDAVQLLQRRVQQARIVAPQTDYGQRRTGWLGVSELEKKIEQLVGAPAAYVLDGADLLRMRKPCVYIHARGDETLYVGKGSRGFQRPLDCQHHRLRDVEPADRLLVYHCSTGTEAELERTLIAALQPRFNGKSIKNDTFDALTPLCQNDVGG